MCGNMAKYSRVIFKRNEWLDVSAVKIGYFFKKIFHSYVYVLVDNDTSKILKGLKFVNSHIFMT